MLSFETIFVAAIAWFVCALAAVWTRRAVRHEDVMAPVPAVDLMRGLAWMALPVAVGGYMALHRGGGAERANALNAAVATVPTERPTITARPMRPSRPQPTPEPAITGSAMYIWAVDLSQDYRRNELAADGLYKDKLMVVGGTVTQIRRTGFGDAVVDLKGSGWSDVHVYLRESSASRAATLRKGDWIYALGKCTGMRIGSVVLHDAAIVNEADVFRAYPAIVPKKR